MMEKFDEFYSPFRERIGNFGVITAVISVVVLSHFIRTGIFEAILDFIGILGMVAGVVVSAAGVFMLGMERGWWDKLIGQSGQVGRVPPAPGEFVQHQPYAVIEEGEPPPFEEIEPSYYPGSTPVPDSMPASPAGPAFDESMNPIQSAQPHRALQIAPLMMILAIAPAVLLILSALPVTPWFSLDVEAVGYEGWAEDLDATRWSLWDTVAQIREYEEGYGIGSLDIEWETAFIAYVIAIIGTLLNGLVFFIWRNSHRGYQAEQEGASRDNLDLFLITSIFICSITLPAILHALQYIRFGPLVFPGFGVSSGYSLGPYLCGLAALGVVGYLVFLVTNGTTKSRFASLNMPSIVSVAGRVTRPTFFLVLGVITIVPHFVTLYISTLATDELVSTGLTLMLLVWVIATSWVWLALHIRRYHDLDMSGWLVLINLIPAFVIGTATGLLFAGIGPPGILRDIMLLYSEWAAIVNIPLPLAISIFPGFIKGTLSPNLYGPSLEYFSSGLPHRAV